jgi:hypothetical protein
MLSMRISARSTGNNIPAIHAHFARVTCNKKGGNQHKIPYAMTFSYVHPPIDNVPPEFRVDVPEETVIDIKGIITVEEAIAVYLQAFRQKFQSREGRKQRSICLQYFQRYLVAQGHSMMVRDLTLADGQGFLDSLTNHYNGLPLKPSELKKYRSGLRSFSRFLHELGIIGENVFLAVTMK